MTEELVSLLPLVVASIFLIVGLLIGKRLSKIQAVQKFWIVPAILVVVSIFWGGTIASWLQASFAGVVEPNTAKYFSIGIMSLVGGMFYSLVFFAHNARKENANKK